MNDPIHIKFVHNGVLFQIDPYYNPIASMESVESPIEGEPIMPDNPGW